MTDLTTAQKLAEEYRQKSFRLERSLWLKDKREAVSFVDQRGFVFFWPIKDITFPSLWKATVGNRPVPNNHDDPGHITWRWKDELIDKRVWYYAKLIRKKSTIISLKLAPSFYVLSPNLGDYENDYLVRYKNGLMSQEMKVVYEALLKHGAMHTLELRQKASLTSTESKYRFNKALSDLHADMMIQPVGIAQAGRWGYAMIYEITARYHPEIVEEARFITELQAQKNILISFFNSVGLASQKELSRVFPWKKEFLLKACNTLVAEKKLLDLGGVDKNTHYFSSPAIFRLQ